MKTVRLIGRSAQHRTLLETLAKVAPSNAEVLISGPTGVGKELYARYVHEQSDRRAASFVAVNCGALASDLLENELFGHIGGAFTGARPQHQGLVAEAEEGTLFLDEVDTLSPANQVKLLRFIQEKEYRRLGESRVRRVNVRFVAATNASLADAVRDGSFRSDLFFRLRVVPVEVPPLCERPEDVGALLEEFVPRYAELYQLPAIRLSAAATEALEQYSWPGNIRELENCVRYLTCLQLQRDVGPADLPLLPQNTDVPIVMSSRAFREAKRNMVGRFEREYLQAALRRASGNITRAAEESGKPRRAFFELLRKHEIDASTFRSNRR
jgi:two-component system response regulator GlrR